LASTAYKDAVGGDEKNVEIRLREKRTGFGGHIRSMEGRECQQLDREILLEKKSKGGTNRLQWRNQSVGFGKTGRPLGSLKIARRPSLEVDERGGSTPLSRKKVL